MMSLHRLGPVAEEYYLSQVAGGIEDYYSEGNEAPGRWLSRSADLLSLDGAVSGDDLRSVLGGRHPGTGESLHHTHNRSTPGWDLTFRAPKSVSLLWGVADRDVASEVATAHRVAVGAALGYLERLAGFTRTGKNGLHRAEADAFLAAGFDHRTSRDGDPHLHTHVLVSNSVLSADGRWRTIDGKGIYRHKMAASYLYDAELRHQLTARLGVDWDPVVNGVAEIVGIDPELCRHFSKRREAIEDKLAEWGASSGAAAEQAALRTRQAKTAAESTVMLKARWRTEVTTSGWSLDDDVTSVLDPTRATRLTVDNDVTTAAMAHLAGPLGVTEQESSFDRRDVIRHLTALLPGAVGAAQLEETADAFLARPEVCEVRSDHPEPTFTTVELLATEQRLLAGAVARVDAECGLVDVSTVDQALAQRPSMAEEQAELVRQLCYAGAGVEVVVAPPGTGKTFSLDAARQAWEDSGFRVLGCALSASAAAELHDGAGIPATTIARLHDKLGRGFRLDERAVMVVDEAGMAGTRQLAPILDNAARHGGKVVLVGDPRQLPEIHAGGLLAELDRQLPTVRLSTNRRQLDLAEINALDRLRQGDTDTAIEVFVQRFATSGTNADTVRQAMVDDWWTFTQNGSDARMLAPRWSDADDLNRRARHHLHRAGRLTGEPIVVAERPFQVGDQIICLRNDYQRGLRNGMTGTIDLISHEHRQIVLSTDDGRRILPADYLDAGYLRHGYAVTIHKAQGSTCDHSLVLGSDDLYREMGYVALSRGRDSNRMYLVDNSERSVDFEAHTKEPGRDDRSAVDLVRDALTTSRAKDLATSRAREPELDTDYGIDIGP